MRRALVGLLSLIALAGCGDDEMPMTDADIVWFDGGADFDGGPDFDAGPRDTGTRDAGPGFDAGPLPLESEPAPPAVVEATGTHLVLRGTILTPDLPIDGEIRVEDGLITCIDVTCPHDDATVIATNSVISPGLIDTHNHLPYNWIPEWEPDPTMLFNNRYEWSEEESYESHIAPFSDRRSSNIVFCPSALWGELRSMVHGTTTMMGQSFDRSCTSGGVRNADHKHRLGYNHMRTTIGSVRDINDEAAAGYVASFTEASEPKTRFAVHMQEGLMGSGVDAEFDSFAGRDPRPNRHQGISLLAGDGFFGVAILIHSMNLSTAQLMEAVDSGAHFVWSPSSNLVLYGETAPIEEMLDLNVSVSLAPDWTVSGADDMLEEMRFARGYGVGQGIPELTDERVWRMSTERAASVVDLPEIGTLEVGQHADITVFGRRGADPYRAVIDSREEDVRLVMIDGQAYYGDLDLESATAVNGACEVFDACGAAKFLCVANLPEASGDWVGDGLEDLRGQLQSILDEYADADPPLSYDAPLPLVNCR